MINTTYSILISGSDSQNALSAPTLGQANFMAYHLSHCRECVVLDNETGAVMSIYRGGEPVYFDPDPYLGY